MAYKKKMAMVKYAPCFRVKGSLSVNFDLNFMVIKKYAVITDSKKIKKYGLQSALNPKMPNVSTTITSLFVQNACCFKRLC